MSDLWTSIKASIAISMFFKPTPPTLWFVTILLFYYLLSPLLINCINNEKLILILVTFFLTSGFLLISHYFFRNLDVRVITYFPAYLLGLLISLKGDDFINKNGFFCIFIVGVFISILLKNNIRSFDLLSSIIMLATAPYFIFMLFKNRMKLSDNLIKTISILAYSSYCMYLFHRPIYITLKNIYFPESEALQVLYLVCFCLPCIIIFSYFVQKFYDSSIDSLTKSSAKLAKSHR
jgi:peptidoglycan/LPS O-acetylase OafA/YrhL